MKYTYTISGMTCNGCVASVEKHLSQLTDVNEVSIDLASEEVILFSSGQIPIHILQDALPKKYSITAKEEVETESRTIEDETKEKSKLQQLRPLFLILFYISTASIAMHYTAWSWNEFMYDFMGLFYIVFSFFKMLDLKGFPDSFRMYDPLAKKIPLYGYIYPFLEIALGIMFLTRFELNIALWSTVFMLGITTIGVTKTLLNKRSIQCACLGTALKLPMTQATFIENAIMIAMALIMLLN